MNAPLEPFLKIFQHLSVKNSSSCRLDKVYFASNCLCLLLCCFLLIDSFSFAWSKCWWQRWNVKRTIPEESCTSALIREALGKTSASASKKMVDWKISHYIVIEEEIAVKIYWEYRTARHLVFWKPWPAVEQKKVLSVTKHGFVFWAQRKPNTRLEIYKAFQDRLTCLNLHMIV